MTDALARVVEGEILLRLRRLHRRPDHPRNTTRQPTAAEIQHLHALLLAPGPVDLDAEVAALLGGDMVLDTVLLDLLVLAARQLGRCGRRTTATSWRSPRASDGSRCLCAELEEDATRAERSVLLMPCPGETHLYAQSIVAGFFRRAGRDATVLDGADADAADLLREKWFDAVGLSLACDVHMPVMKEMGRALRYASRNPALAVIVGGP